MKLKGKIKRISHRSLGIILSLALFAGLFSGIVFYNKVKSVSAGSTGSVKTYTSVTLTADPSDDYNIEWSHHYVEKDRTYTLGTANNPFVMLEVVGCEKSAEMGYMIMNFSPVDIFSPRFMYTKDSVSLTTQQGVIPAFPKSQYGTGVALKFFNQVTKQYEEKEYNSGNPYLRWITYDINEYNKAISCGAATANSEGSETNNWYGYYERLSTQTGNYDLNSSSNGFVANSSNTGWYQWVGLSYYDNKNLSASTISSVYGKPDFTNVTDTGKKVYTCIANSQTYSYRWKNVYDYTNYFVLYSIGLAYTCYDTDLNYTQPTSGRVLDTDANISTKLSKYHCIVLTTTPEDINNNLQLIDNCDLITFSETSQNSTYESDWAKYFNTNLFDYDTSSLTKNTAAINDKAGATFVTNDLSWEAAIKIFTNHATSNLAVQFNNTNVTTDMGNNTGSDSVTYTFSNGYKYTQKGFSGTENNFCKLFIMCTAMDAQLFYELYVQTGMLVSDTSKSEKIMGTDGSSKQNTTGVFKTSSGEDVRYWFNGLFIPSQLASCTDETASGAQTVLKAICTTYGIPNNLGGTVYNCGENFNYYVRDGVLTFKGDNALTSDYKSGSEYSGSGVYITDAYNWFKNDLNDTESQITGNKMSTETALFYLLNYTRNRYYHSVGDLKILEVEPCDDFDSDVVWIVRLFGIFGSKRKVGAKNDITKITTSELAAYTDDFTDYDLVYFGGNKTETSASSSSENIITKYNGGLSYANIGASVSSDYYSGNDITDEVATSLKNYAAVRCVLVSDDLLTTTSSTSAVLNDSLFDTNSNVYKCLNSLESGSNIFNETLLYGTYVNTTKKTAFIERCVDFAPKILSLDSGSPAIYTSGSNYLGDTISFSGKIASYDSKTGELSLYIDKNSDGRFKEGEKVSSVNKTFTSYYSDEPSKDIAAGNDPTGVTFTISDVDISKLSGAVSWRLVSTVGGNVTSSIEGVSARKTSENAVVNVLQIVNDGSDDGVILPTTDASYVFNTDGTMPSSYFTDTVVSNQYKFSITKMTLSEYITAYKDNNSILSGYNVIVAGLDSSFKTDSHTGDDDKKAISAIADGAVPVVYGYGAFSNANALSYFRENAGQVRYNSTVTAKAQNSSSAVTASGTSNYKLAGFSSAADKATESTIGAVTNYPYTLGSAVSLSSAKSPLYQLSLESGKMAVFYNLASSGTSYMNDTKNDTRNNYYLYNNGTVYYIGLGLTASPASDEYKLFVNTLIAAYNTALKPATIDIVNDGVVNNGNNAYLYYDCDATGGGIVYGTEDDDIYTVSGKYYKRVYFKLNDFNGMKYEKFFVSIFDTEANYKSYIASPDATLFSSTLTKVYKKDDDSKVELNDKNFDADTVYYVDVPIDPTDTTTSGVSNFVVAAEMFYSTDGTDYKNSKLWGYKNVKVIPNGLFNLD